MNNTPLDTLIHVFKKTHDPRKPRGIRHDYHGTLILVFMGLLARLPYIAHIQRWADTYWHILQKPLGFKRKKPPHDTTISRMLAKVPLKELQDAFNDFLNTLLIRKLWSDLDTADYLRDTLNIPNCQFGHGICRIT